MAMLTIAQSAYGDHARYGYGYGYGCAYYAYYVLPPTPAGPCGSYLSKSTGDGINELFNHVVLSLPNYYGQPTHYN